MKQSSVKKSAASKKLKRINSAYVESFELKRSLNNEDEMSSNEYKSKLDKKIGMALMEQNERLRSTNFDVVFQQKNINDIIINQMRNEDDVELIRDPNVSKMKNKFQNI
jgi:conjugal transfer/entry exclusion protein